MRIVRTTVDTFTAQYTAVIDERNGRVTMTAQNFEAPVDFNGDNAYQVTLTATDAEDKARWA